ncbi:MAG: ISAs1-like element ISEc5 family transposase [Termitinemataceae bacterium]|nr:MAG: ISAs1-like element ISEc5 family transposase [Termitinemataceae bacterium]
MEAKVARKPIIAYFSEVKDPRTNRNKLRKYPLIEVIVITILAVISSAKGWEDIERYGKAKRKWLEKFLPLEHGIPKHDVYRLVFIKLGPTEIEQCFMNWVRDIKQSISREVIAIDGKAVRGTFNAESGKSLHLVSAWATANKLIFGQVKTDEKSNEITAIPHLLEKIALEGCIVTIDAMGCQHAIAEQIVRKKADYVFSLKGNKGNLHEAVEEYWEGLDFNAPVSAQARHIRFNSTSTHDTGHGREEYRDYAVSDDVAWLHKEFPLWKTIRSIGMVEETRAEGEKITIGRRYFVSSLEADVELFAHAVRSHWGIENSLHYVLDVAFGEDACRIRTDKGPENMAFIRKIALTLARSDKESKSSMVGRLKQMGWDNDYLEQMLFDSGFGANSAAG